MTINELQREIMADLERVLSGLSLTGANGQVRSIKAYAQALPIIPACFGQEIDPEYYNEDTKEDDRQEDMLFPYVVVRITGCRYEDAERKATVYLLFGIVNGDHQMSGYFELLNALERTITHYRKNPVLGAFYCDANMEMALQEDDSHPYFFGGIEMTWNLTCLIRE